MYVLGYSQEEEHCIANNLKYRLSTFPITYLGFLVSDSRILFWDMYPLVHQVRSHMELWWGMFLSKGANTILINPCLYGLPMFLMGSHLLTEGIHLDMEKEISLFLWQGLMRSRSATWSNGSIFAASGTMVVPGIFVSHKINVALLL